MMININGINGNWKEIKNKLKKKFALLTESDLLLINGKQDELINRLQLRLGKSKEDLQQIILDLEKKQE